MHVHKNIIFSYTTLTLLKWGQNVDDSHINLKIIMIQIKYCYIYNHPSELWSHLLHGPLFLQRQSYISQKFKKGFFHILWCDMHNHTSGVMDLIKRALLRLIIVENINVSHKSPRKQTYNQHHYINKCKHKFSITQILTSFINLTIHHSIIQADKLWKYQRQ